MVYFTIPYNSNTSHPKTKTKINKLIVNVVLPMQIVPNTIKMQVYPNETYNMVLLYNMGISSRC